MSEATSSPQEESGAAPTPPHRLVSHEAQPPSRMGCGICALLAAAGLLLLYSWLSRNEPAESPRHMLPDYTVLYIETPDCESLLEASNALTGWAASQGAGDGRQLLRPVEEMLQAWLGPTSALPVAPDQLRGPAAFALVPPDEGSLVAAIFLDAGSHDRARDIAMSKPQRSHLPPSEDTVNPSAPEYIDDMGRYVFATGRWIVVTPSKRLKQYIGGKRPENSAVLSPLPFDPHAKKRLLAGMVCPREYRRRRVPLAPELFPWLTLAPMSDNQTASSRVAWQISKGRHDGLVLEVRPYGAQPGKQGNGRGIFGWIGCILLWIAGIVIGLIALLIAITLLLALYFYVEQWRRGELSPPTPPTHPEPSPQLQEDMESNPIRFSNKKAGGEKPSGEEESTPEATPDEEDET